MKYLLNIILIIFTITQCCAQTHSGEIALEKNVSLIWITEDFNENAHKIEVCKTEGDYSYISKIDGKPWFGSEIGMNKPRNQLSKLTLKMNGIEIELDISYMYNPSLNGILSQRQFLLEKEGEFYKLYSYFSDGAGSYTVHWKIVNGSSVREVISNNERFYFWQDVK